MAVQNPREGSQCYPIAPSGRWKASADVMRTMDHKRRAGCGESRTSGSEGGQRETRLRRDHVSYPTALIGPRMRARGFAAQQAMAAIGVAVLNLMLATGRPRSVRRQRAIA